MYWNAMKSYLKPIFNGYLLNDNSFRRAWMLLIFCWILHNFQWWTFEPRKPNNINTLIQNGKFFRICFLLYLLIFFLMSQWVLELDNYILVGQWRNKGRGKGVVTFKTWLVQNIRNVVFINPFPCEINKGSRKKNPPRIFGLK